MMVRICYFLFMLVFNSSLLAVKWEDHGTLRKHDGGEERFGSAGGRPYDKPVHAQREVKFSVSGTYIEDKKAFRYKTPDWLLNTTWTCPEGRRNWSGEDMSRAGFLGVEMFDVIDLIFDEEDQVTAWLKFRKADGKADHQRSLILIGKAQPLFHPLDSNEFEVIFASTDACNLAEISRYYEILQPAQWQLWSKDLYLAGEASRMYKDSFEHLRITGNYQETSITVVYQSSVSMLAGCKHNYPYLF